MTVPSHRPYRLDLAIFNKSNNSVAMLELTCPLDSVKNLESARERKQGKKEYQEIQSKFDRLGVCCFYSTIVNELSVLGHYLSPSLSSLQNCINFVDETTMTLTVLILLMRLCYQSMQAVGLENF